MDLVLPASGDNCHPPAKAFLPMAYAYADNDDVVDDFEDWTARHSSVIAVQWSRISLCPPVLPEAPSSVCGSLPGSAHAPKQRSSPASPQRSHWAVDAPGCHGSMPWPHVSCMLPAFATSAVHSGQGREPPPPPPSAPLTPDLVSAIFLVLSLSTSVLS